MRLSGSPIIWAFAPFIIFSTAVPLLPDVAASLAPRSQVCANDPSIVAGTYYGRRSILPIALKLRFTPLERQQVVWCALRSATFVIISAAQSIPGTTVYTTLVDAALNQLTMLEQMGDGPIANGAYDRLGPGNIALHVWNTNNHQITRGVLSAALDALADYVETRFAGALSFYIYDGDNEVGQGLIGLSG